jgi:hypothetical protein
VINHCGGLTPRASVRNNVITSDIQQTIASTTLRIRKVSKFMIYIDGEKNIAYIRLSGKLTKEIILHAFDSSVADEKYKKGMGRLWDFRDADLSALTHETISEMAQYSLRFPPGVGDVKVAFLTGRDLEYGLSRMFELVSRAKTPIRVFRSIEEAEEWLMA